MNVLLLTEYFPASLKGEITGGVESRVFNIAKGLAKKHKVRIMTSWRNNLKRHEFFENIEVIRVGPEHKYSNYGGFVSRLLFARAVCKKGASLENVELVHGFNFTTYLPAYKIAKKIDKKVVITYHETWVNEWIKNKGLVSGFPYELYERFLLKLDYDSIISVSEFTKKRLIRAGIHKKKIEVIPNGIDFSYLNNLKSKKYNSPTICFVGRLVKTKNVEVLINAIKIIKARIPDIKCKIIGKGPEENKLKNLVKRLNLVNTIEFLGFLPNYEDVVKTLRSSHIFCFPSTVEGFGIVMIESMALKTPYVCSDIPVLKEITQNGKGGEIFKKNESNDLAKKVLSLLTNKKEYRKKQKEAEELAKKYDWKTVVKMVEKRYEKVIKTKQ